MQNLSSEELFYSGPMVLSVQTMKDIRKELIRLIEDVTKLVEPSPAERLACLNIDWFKVEK